MAVLLDVIYAVAAFACSPVLLYRYVRSGKYREGWAEKLLGRAPNRIGEAPCLWFHAVSVGEVLLLRPLVRLIARRRPGWQVVISTTTSTGLAVARKTFPDLVTFYAPLDFSWATEHAIARVRPTVLALVELELWPNLIRAAKQSGAKVAVINARLSSRSYRGYRNLRGPLRTTFSRIDFVAAQNEEYAQRFIELGLDSGRVSVTGSVKFDGLESNRDNPRTYELRRLLGLAATDLVFVAGSTMEGEETAALEAYRGALKKHPNLRLIVAPRHAERFDSVCRDLSRLGETVVRKSDLDRPLVRVPGVRAPVVVIDTIGDLAAIWGLADVAFVGGSLLPGRGGQNMMEPAAYGAAVMFGPHTSNFRETVDQLLKRQAARRVLDARDLAQGLIADLDDPETAAARGSAGREFVLAQHGAAGRTAAVLDRLVELPGSSRSG